MTNDIKTQVILTVAYDLLPQRLTHQVIITEFFHLLFLRIKIIVFHMPAAALQLHAALNVPF